ncbi:MAG: ABC transporter permease [Deltaproteobacteria bacterium RBG_16_47_11]|jgi:branched-chain amino acid transport system permease protein|nr:MAG: ABC transporter permease [Deltaproteobacteria bacterium RBG_16_47_11]
MNLLVQVLIAGITIGSIYSLIAIGFVLIFKSSGVINFAQGSLVMVGAFITYAFVTQFKVPILLSILITFLISGAIGMIIERFVLRYLTGVSLISIIMVTMGISFIMDGGALATWGSSNFTFPSLFPPLSLLLGGIKISSIYLWSFITSILLLVVFLLFFKYSKMGLAMRAAADNQKAAVTLGISPRKVLSLTWAISAVVATAGGILLASISALHVNLSYIGLIVFPVVILGGLDSIAGAVVGGFIVGVLEAVSGVYIAPLLGGAFQQVAAFAFLLIILLIKPYGLFGTKEIERL